MGAGARKTAVLTLPFLPALSFHKPLHQRNMQLPQFGTIFDEIRLFHPLG